MKVINKPKKIKISFPSGSIFDFLVPSSMILEALSTLIEEGSCITEDAIIAKAQGYYQKELPLIGAEDRQKAIRNALLALGAYKVEKDGEVARLRGLWDSNEPGAEWLLNEVCRAYDFEFAKSQRERRQSIYQKHLEIEQCNE